MRQLHFLANGRLLMTDDPKAWTIQEVQDLVKVRLGTTDIAVILE